MSRRVRLVFACAMLVALPLRGTIAAATIACGPAHDARAALADPVPHVHDASGAARAAPTIDDATPEPHDVPACDTCGACCNGGDLIGSALPALPRLPSASPDFPAIDRRLPGRVPAVPERPPRTLVI